MALKTDIRGMVWQYPDTFVVGREQIRQYAKAVKADDPATLDEDAAAELGHDDLIAPLTFLSIFAVMIQNHFFQQRRRRPGNHADRPGRSEVPLPPADQGRATS